MKKTLTVAMFFCIAILFTQGCKKMDSGSTTSATNATVVSVPVFSCPVMIDETKSIAMPVMAKKEHNTPSQKVLYLDFDGEYVAGTSWGSPYTFPSAGYTTEKKDSVVLCVQRMLAPWNVFVTKNRTAYDAASSDSRQMTIMTPSSLSYFGVNWTGISYISSWYWADGTPNFVFTSNFNNLYQVARLVVHEFGHTLGCYHQSIYDAQCNLQFEYRPQIGWGDLSWCAFMGNPYQGSICTLMNGTPYTGAPNGCSLQQNDLALFDAAIGRRSDDFGSSLSGAPALSSTEKSFVTETPTDVDVFTTTGSKPWIHLVSYNIDYIVYVYNKNGVCIQTLDPVERGLTARIATSGASSNTYYIQVAVSPQLGNVPLSAFTLGAGGIYVTAN